MALFTESWMRLRQQFQVTTCRKLGGESSPHLRNRKDGRITWKTWWQHLQSLRPYRKAVVEELVDARD